MTVKQVRLTSDFHPQVVDGLIVDEWEGHVFLLHPSKPKWALANQTGVMLAESFDGSRSIDDAAESLVMRYGIAKEQALEDVSAFTKNLAEANLLANVAPRSRIVVDKSQEAHRLTIFVTEECNLRCKHCFVVEGKMPKPTLTEDDIRDLIDEHLKLHPEALIAFSGGEALLRPDCLDLLEYAASKTHRVTLNSNGHLIDESAARRLANAKIGVQISLDGPNPEIHDFIRGKGSFNKAWRAIELLSKAGAAPYTRIATTLTLCSLPHVKELIERADKANLYETRFLVLQKVKAAETNWEKVAPNPEDLLEIYRYILLEVPAMDNPPKVKIEGEFPGFVPFPDPEGKHWCPMGETTIVNSQGEAYGCPILVSGEYAVGNVSKESLGDIQQGEKMKGMRDRMLKRRYAIEECQVCAWRNFCQGGCQAFMQMQSGSIWSTDEYCDFRRELYRKHALRLSGVK